MRFIYISPHLDDAVLSAGGYLYDISRSGTLVEIWTVCCGFPQPGEPSPFAQVLHFQWGFSSAEETVRLRRAEDVNAAAAVGAKAVHFDFLDCIYRRGPDGAWLYPQEVFVPPHAAEADLPAKMTAALAARLQPDDVVACQLAIGRHVDHVTVRKAAEGLGRPLVYFADIPYLLNSPEQLGAASTGMQARVQPVSESGLEAWQAGVAAYVSQISMLFERPEQMREAIQGYGRPGIRTWEFE
jgi:LmbE family N-acetylglucosaminyl deacetylase